MAGYLSDGHQVDRTDVRFARDQFCGAVQQRVFPSLPFIRAETLEQKMKQKQKKSRQGRKERAEKRSLVAKSPCHERAIEEKECCCCAGKSVCTDGRTGEGGCGGMTGGVVEPTAGRGGERRGRGEGEGAKGRRPEWREDRRRNDKGKGRRASGATARGRGETKGVVAAEALEGRRSQCTAGECNARAARRAKQY